MSKSNRVGKVTMIEHLISKWAESVPKAPVFFGQGQRALSYQELAQLIAQFRTRLPRFGIGPQDRIAIVHSGGAEMAAAVVGIAACSIAVPLNPELSAGEFALHLKDKKVTAIAVEAGLKNPVRQVAGQLSLPLLEIVQDDRLVAGKIALSGPENLINIASSSPTEEDLMLVLTTSGTTSYGKIVPITHGQAIERARQITQMLHLTQQDRGMNLMPLFHIGGLSAGVMATLYSGSSLMPIKNGHVNTLFHCLDEIQPTYIAGGYTVFHAIERKAPAFRDVIDRVKPQIRMLRTGTGRLDQHIADHLEQIFDAPVVEAYGSSETGFMSCTALSPQRQKPGSVGQPVHTNLTIVDPEGQEVPIGQEGEIVVKGPNVFSGYENDPNKNIEAFKDGHYHTGDQGYLDEDGYLFITGRIKEMINRGGMKIAPIEIDQAMIKHDAVADAAAIPVSHPSLGEDVAAVVVLHERETLKAQELIKFLGHHLAPYKIPSRIYFRDSLPRTATGKLKRRDLASQIQTQANAFRSGKTGQHTESALEETLLGIWQEAMGISGIGRHDNFFDLGGDSLQAVDLFLLIENRLEQQLSRDILFEAGTIAEMAELIERKSKTSCVVPIQPKGARPPFFCIHPIEGEVIGYRHLAGYLDEDQPFYGIQCLRQGINTPLFSSIEEMAEYYLTEIRKIQPVGPYFLGGHSFGGLVAYTIAQKLTDSGGKVGLLAMFDSFNTTVSRYVSPIEWAKRHWRVMASLPLSERPGYAKQRLRNLFGLIPTKLSLLKIKMKNKRSSEQRASHDPEGTQRIRENNMLISRKFEPKPFRGDAVLFATELPTSWHGDVHESWKDLVQGTLTVRHLSGGHLEIMREPYVRELAEELSICLHDKQNNEPSVNRLVIGGNR